MESSVFFLAFGCWCVQRILTVVVIFGHLPPPADNFSGMRLRLGGYMSGNRFNDLCPCLFLTNHAPPSYKDPFWEVRQFMKAWNDNMLKNFMPGWVNCLMNRSANGWDSILVQGSCAYLANPGLLGMNIIQFVVGLVVFFMLQSWLKVRTSHATGPQKNSVNLERQWVSYWD